jgi:general secretion pathway protein C
MLARLCALLVWALVVLSVAFWGSLWSAAAPAKPASRPVAKPSEPPRAEFTRILGEPVSAPGAAAPARAAESRFALSGVVAPTRADGTGIALIAVDGKRAGAYLVGASVDGDVALKFVGQRGVTLAPANGAPFVLELPRPAPPATGALRAAVASTATPAPPTAAGTAAPGTAPAAAATVSATTTTAAAEVDPAPTPELVQETPLGVQTAPATPSPGRRQRLRGLGTAPTGTGQTAR